MNQQENAKRLIRQERNLLLSQSDWTQGNDSPLSNDKKTEWAEYRRLLRDFPSTFTEVPLNDKGYIDESQLTWPTKPE